MTFIVVVARILIGVRIGVRRIAVGRDVLCRYLVMVLMRGAEGLGQRRLHRAYRKDQREQPINRETPVHRA